MLRLLPLLLAALVALPAHAQPGPEAECPPATEAPTTKPPRTSRATSCTDPALGHPGIHLAMVPAARTEVCLAPTAGKGLGRCLADLLRAPDAAR
jgi:hypothetical protein